MARPKKTAASTSPQAQLAAVIKTARDAMRKDAGLNGDLDRIPQLAWLLFLKAFDTDPMWNIDPRYMPYRDSLATAHLPGWPAPVSRETSQSVAKYVVVDMFAKACAGASTREVIANAVAQLKQIYGQS